MAHSAPLPLAPLGLARISGESADDEIKPATHIDAACHQGGHKSKRDRTAKESLLWGHLCDLMVSVSFLDHLTYQLNLKGIFGKGDKWG